MCWHIYIEYNCIYIQNGRHCHTIFFTIPPHYNIELRFWWHTICFQGLEIQYKNGSLLINIKAPVTLGLRPCYDLAAT